MKCKILESRETQAVQTKTRSHYVTEMYVLLQAG